MSDQSTKPTAGNDTATNSQSTESVAASGTAEATSTPPEKSTAEPAFTTSDVTSSGPMMSTSAFAVLIIFICAIIAGGVYWWLTYGTTDAGQADRIDFSATSGSEEVVPIEEVPDVVATVNGVEVPKERLVENVAQIEAVLAQQGQDPNNPSIAAQVQTQALDQVINNEVLAQAADAAGMTVSEADVAAELAGIRSQFPDEAAFTTELQNAGLTPEQLERELGQQLVIRQFVESSDAVSNLPEVTTADARAAYEQVIAQGGGVDVPPFEEVEEQIVTSIAQQNRQLAETELINSLREAADIEVLF